jgi:hypothetical protein
MQVRASAIDEWLNRVRGEYLEMPGLRLSLAQAERFWSLDCGTCARVLDALVKARFLVVTSEGLYRRPALYVKKRAVFTTASGRLIASDSKCRCGPSTAHVRQGSFYL